MEQLIIMGKGAYRLSANDLKEEIERTKEEARRNYIDKESSGKAYIGDQITDDILGDDKRN